MTISAKALAKYRNMLFFTSGFSRYGYRPATVPQEYYDRIMCPACVGNINPKQYRILLLDGSWEWLKESAAVQELLGALSGCLLSVVDELEIISMVDVVQAIEEYDILEQRVVSTYMRGDRTWEPCPICHNTGEQLFHQHVPEKQVCGHARLLKGYIDIPTVAEFLHLPTYDKWVKRSDAAYAVNLQAVRKWFVHDHLGDPTVTEHSAMGTWYECPACDGIDAPNPGCELCEGGGEVCWDDIRNYWYKDEFLAEVLDDENCPLCRAYNAAVLAVLQDTLLRWLPIELKEWPSGELQLVSSDWKAVYREMGGACIGPEPPAGSFRQRVMWYLHTNSVMVDSAYLRTRFYRAISYQLASLQEGQPGTCGRKYILRRGGYD